MSPGEAMLGIDYETLHAPLDSVPYTTYSNGTKTRILHARPEEGFLVSQIVAPPGVTYSLHRHNQHTFGWTNAGEWGHDTTYPYRAGSYIFETPGVPHRFYAGGDSPADVVFVVFGSVDYLDDGGELIKTVTTEDVARIYFEDCERQGLPRPNVLS
jgi:quercetin dioxygenase-like cupin family protein